MTFSKEKKYICRSIEAGVFYGDIVEKNGAEVTMTDARCLWYWSGAASLNQLAEEGVKNPDGCKFTMPTKKVVLTNVCEILEVADFAKESIEKVKSWKA